MYVHIIFLLQVVDEHATQAKPEPKNHRTHILKSDWFWYTIQNGYADEMDYLFGDVSIEELIRGDMKKIMQFFFHLFVYLHSTLTVLLIHQIVIVVILCPLVLINVSVSVSHNVYNWRVRHWDLVNDVLQYQMLAFSQYRIVSLTAPLVRINWRVEN